MSKKGQANTQRTPRESNVSRASQVGRGAQPLSDAGPKPGPKPSTKPGTGGTENTGSATPETQE